MLVENMKHIYICRLWSKGNGNHKPKNKIIFSDNVSEKIKVNKYFIIIIIIESVTHLFDPEITQVSDII